MNRVFALAALLCLPVVARADLATDIRSALADKLLLKADVAVQIVQIDDSPARMKVIYQHTGTTPLLPASNLKLLTTAAALDKLGPDFKFRTYLVLHDGDAIIWGDGDPTFGDAEMLKKAGWDVTTVYRNWSELLKKQRITSVHDVVVDDSVFDEQFVHLHWPPDQEHKRYVAGVGGLNLNANCVDFYLRAADARQVVSYLTNPPTGYISVRNSCVTGEQNAVWLSRPTGTNNVILRGETNASSDIPVSVTVHDPPLFAATVLAETLRECGIKVTGQVQRDRTSRADWSKASDEQKRRWTVLAVHETPLSIVLARANKDSMNLYAEALCKRLGHEVARASGSWENGTAAVAAFLKRIGADDNQFQLDDGCGLSRQDAVSPDTFTRVLAYEFHLKDNAPFLNSLAVAGYDGTLSDRFKGSDLQGRVFAKSGFITGVSALSGYLKAKDGQWYAFSILFNGIPAGNNSGAKQIQEAIVRALDAHAAKAR